MAVWFGRSWYNPEVVLIMEEGTVFNETVYEEGVPVEVPILQGEVESWLSRTDMSFSRFEIKKEKLDEAEKNIELSLLQVGKILSINLKQKC